jgi:Holliday junction resolvase RusA-like endonuclease
VSDVIRIEIPGPPRGYARTGSRVVTPKDGGKPFATRFTPAATRIEAGVVRMFAAEAMNGNPPMEGPIDLRIAAFCPIPKSWSQKRQRAALADEIRPTSKPDWTNIARFEDALKSIAWRDDAQVTDAAIWKRYSANPRVILEIRQCQLAQPASSGRKRISPS